MLESCNDCLVGLYLPEYGNALLSSSIFIAIPFNLLVCCLFSTEERESLVMALSVPKFILSIKKPMCSLSVRIIRCVFGIVRYRVIVIALGLGQTSLLTRRAE